MVCTMRRKIQRAMGLVKDQASLTRAMMFSGNGIGALEMAVVQATSHDDSAPVDDKYVHEILFIVSNTPGSVLHLASFLTKRLERTRDAVVVLKLLMLVHRLLRGGHRRFEQDLRDTHSSGVLRMRFYGLPAAHLGEGHAAASSGLVPFLHDYASFLDLRMGWFINQAGRLESTTATTSTTQFVANNIGADSQKIWAQPILIVLPRCQEILDRIVECFPGSGMVRRNRLVQAALESILRESFHLYSSFSDGVGTLVELLKQGVRDSGDLALHILKRASHQSYELVRFFENCKAVCSVRFDDYPSVTITISREDVSQLEMLIGCVAHGRKASKVVEDDAGDDGDEAGADVSSRSSSSPSMSLGTVMNNYPFKPQAPLLCTSPMMRLFSRRWERETKVSTEWVVFDNDDNIKDKLGGDAISFRAAASGVLLL